MSIVIDNPDHIYAFGLLQHYHRMKLTLNTGVPWRFNSFEWARNFLEQHGEPRPTRSRQKTFDAYERYLQKIGVLKDGTG